MGLQDVVTRPHTFSLRVALSLHMCCHQVRPQVSPGHSPTLYYLSHASSVINYVYVVTGSEVFFYVSFFKNKARRFEKPVQHVLSSSYILQ